ncbi:hypothetical protein EVAR_44219_1 [Eumeta japonica]|uniref:Uncharacterized protein n=1 Tax=Eumeta variegata TaxID=151549 RepID=A0A4C1W0U1_EUMVA|nr:hypothetical protein EVAR_44219_1 [Eumeta japonica]
MYLVSTLCANTSTEKERQAFLAVGTAKQITKEIDEIHKSASFDLKSWASNEPETLDATENTKGEQNAFFLGDHMERTLILDDIENKKNDMLGFLLNLRNTPNEVIYGEQPPMKR